MRLLFLLSLITLSLSLFSQSSYSIEKILKGTTFDYMIDEDGDYLVNYRTRTGRDQEVIIRNNTNFFLNVEIREILSIAKVFIDENIPEDLSNHLLIDNYATKYLGNWSIFEKDNIKTILFIVKLPFNIDQTLLEAAITETAEAADALEHALEPELISSGN